MEPRKAKEKIPKGHYGNCRHRCLSDNTESFTSYFSRVLKQVHMGLSLSQEAVNVMSSFAGRLAPKNKRPTITSREIQTSVSLLLPGEMGKHARSEATKAVIKYTTSR
ncbi:hypothetical protein FD755_023589 [Muntiacus reevesi]|uniref:Core Histone H2A/H2B/H3 domain-containing protein n=1 Tax=Muntiacus reevesi TaxID=9886 RepID=A0A5N3VWZ4_MUNRE|nr:hypothetical protein FD755_023589 [Muntiacus reevesi]